MLWVHGRGLGHSATAGRDKPSGAKRGWLARIKAGLGKTRANLTDGLADLFLGKKQIDDELITAWYERLERSPKAVLRMARWKLLG